MSDFCIGKYRRTRHAAAARSPWDAHSPTFSQNCVVVKVPEPTGDSAPETEQYVPDPVLAAGLILKLFRRPAGGPNPTQKLAATLRKPHRAFRAHTPPSQPQLRIDPQATMRVDLCHVCRAWLPNVRQRMEWTLEGCSVTLEQTSVLTLPEGPLSAYQVFHSQSLSEPSGKPTGTRDPRFFGTYLSMQRAAVGRPPTAGGILALVLAQAQEFPRFSP